MTRSAATCSVRSLRPLTSRNSLALKNFFQRGVEDGLGYIELALRFLSKDAVMKVLESLLILVFPVLSGCISSSSPPAPAKNTTVIVPQDSKTTVICQDGTKPP